MYLLLIFCNNRMFSKFKTIIDRTNAASLRKAAMLDA
jgi:hypothetical protein